MAFQLYNFSEVSSSLNQGITTAAIATPTSATSTQQGSMNIFSYYSASDSIATISAADYFLPIVIDLMAGDIIFVTSNTDGSTILQVLTATDPTATSVGTVTTVPYLNYQNFTQVTATTLSNAQLLGMSATPVQLVAAKGPGTLIVVDRMLLDYHFLTAATAAGGAIVGQYNNTATAGGIAATATIAAATLNGFTANAQMLVGNVAVSQLNTAVLNTGIYITNATAAFTTGAGSAVVYTWYRVLTPS